MDTVALVHCASSLMADAWPQVREDIAAGRLLPVLEDCNPGDLEKVHAVYVGQGGYLPLRVCAFLDFTYRKSRSRHTLIPFGKEGAYVDDGAVCELSKSPSTSPKTLKPAASMVIVRWSATPEDQFIQAGEWITRTFPWPSYALLLLVAPFSSTAPQLVLWPS